LVVRHEDLAADPERAFADMYAALGLSFSERVAAAIRVATSADNPADVSSDAQHALARDSRAIAAVWRSRLTPAQIDVVRTITGEVATAFYGADAWS